MHPRPDVLAQRKGLSSAEDVACVAHCSVCPFAVDGKPNKPVLAKGPSDPEGILIGEGPGADEVEAGEPFVGVTGQQLSDELLTVGLRRSRLLLINATACRPPPGKTERVMQRAVMACRPLFLKQLEDIDPQTPMFAMGKWAAVAVFGNKPPALMKSRGFIRDNTVPRGETDADREAKAADKRLQRKGKRSSKAGKSGSKGAGRKGSR